MEEHVHDRGEATTHPIRQDTEQEEMTDTGIAPPLSWPTLVTNGVPSLGAIAVTVWLASPEWLTRIILNGGGTCPHGNSC